MPSVGKDIAHDSAVTHVTGQSRFIDDAAPLAGELLAGIIPAPVARGTLRELDVTAARNTPGVIAVLTAADLPKLAAFGPVLHDEWLIVRVEISFLGQPLALVAAETQEALEAAVAAAIVDIDEAEPILDIDAAIAAGSWLSEPRTIACGDLDAGFDDADHILEGSVDIGGQEQFYLESQACLAVPGEQGQMQIHSSTQHTTEVQMLVAEALGVPFNHVVCTCKRMGGAFGGKETQAAPPAMMAALLAQKTRQPVRFVYGKDDDMRYTGKRHPFKSNYRVGFTDDGRITALDVALFANGGCSTDLSFAVLERAMLHTDNAYFLPNMRVVGRVCRTNLPSNTAFRGFGGPQGVASTEHILHDIARHLDADALDVRNANIYRANRNITPYGMVIQNNVLPELFDAIRAESDYDARRAEIDRFNAESQTHVKGLAVSPVKFGISFTRRTLNQANALVNIYLDGSVIVSTGATEMG
ncbi:MAG: molybdopterin cofactor-binding domain-containing protein, partial [Planctomycetota bacterium]